MYAGGFGRDNFVSEDMTRKNKCIITDVLQLLLIHQTECECRGIVFILCTKRNAYFYVFNFM